MSHLKAYRSSATVCLVFRLYVSPNPTELVPSFHRRRPRTRWEFLWPHSLWASGLTLRAQSSRKLFALCCQLPSRGIGTSEHCFWGRASRVTWVFRVSAWYWRSTEDRNRGWWSPLALASALSSVVLRSLGVHEAGPDGVHPGGAAWHGLHHRRHGQRGQGEAGCEYNLYLRGGWPSQPGLFWDHGGGSQLFSHFYVIDFPMGSHFERIVPAKQTSFFYVLSINKLSHFLLS